MIDLAGKVAVVTGAAQGVGLGLAQAFAEAGMRLVLADLDADRLAQAVGSLGTEAIGFATDVADAEAVRHLRDEAFARFGTVHVLCNNAGIGMSASLCEPIDLPAWERLVAVDFFSVLHGIDAFLPRMLEQGNGHIVTTSSRQGLVPMPNIGAYPAAKAASLALMEMLRMELDARGAPIGTTVLTPGGVRTEAMLAAAERADGEMGRFIQARVAEGVEPIDLGRLVVRAIQGNVLYVNTHAETLEWLQARVDRIKADAATLGTLR